MKQGRRIKPVPLISFAVVRDPLCRWEYRRFWTARRYLFACGVLAVFVLLFGGLQLWQWYSLAASGLRTGPVDLIEVVTTMLFKLPSTCRLGMCLIALVVGVTAVLPERLSGQIEQFVLTPVDPWRLGLARYAGRVRGLLNIWLVVGLVSVFGLLAAMLMGHLDQGSGSPQTMILAQAGVGVLWTVVFTCSEFVITYLDLGAMVLLDAAVGLNFSARMRSIPIAALLAGVVSFVAVPIAIWIPGVILSFVGSMFSMFSVVRGGTPGVLWMLTMQMVAWLVHLIAGLWAASLFLRWARGGMRGVFVNPEAGG